MNTNLSQIDVNLIVTLHALLTTRSVSLAAEKVFRTQPATSHALGKLRQHFGDALLVRNGWAMELTEFATTLQAPVEKAVQQLDQVFLTGLDFDPHTSTRTIRVATRDITVPLFSGLIANIRKSAPGMCVKFVDVENYPETIQRSQVDLTLGFGRKVKEGSLYYRDLAPQKFAVFAPVDHPFATQSTLAQWKSARHINVSGGGHGDGPVEKAAAKKKIKRQFAAVAPTFLSALTLARDSNSLLTTLASPLEPYATALGLKVCKCPLSVPAAQAYLLTRKTFGNPFEQWLSNQVSSSFDVLPDGPKD